MEWSEEYTEKQRSSATHESAITCYRRLSSFYLSESQSHLDFNRFDFAIFLSDRQPNENKPNLITTKFRACLEIPVGRLAKCDAIHSFNRFIHVTNTIWRRTKKNTQLMPIKREILNLDSLTGSIARLCRAVVKDSQTQCANGSRKRETEKKCHGERTHNGTRKQTRGQNRREEPHIR